MEVVGGIIGGGWLLRLVVIGFSVVDEGRGFRVSLGVGSVRCWLGWGF